MISGKTLQELALEVERQSNAQHDLIVPSGQMEMRAHDGLAPALAVKGESDLFPMTETGHDTLASRLNIPGRYYERMRAEAPALLSYNVNEWLRQESEQGVSRMVRTLDVLDKLGLAHVGTYRSAEERAAQNGVYVADMGGIKVAFLSYTYGTNGIPVSKSHPDTVNILHTDYMSDAQVLDTERIADDLAAAEALSPDLIAVIVHWGVEYQTTQNEHQEEIADFLFDHGADVILGSHPHVFQPMETRALTDRDGTTHTGFVCWSLGNFISSQNDEYTDTTVVLNLELTKNPNTGVTDVT